MINSERISAYISSAMNLYTDLKRITEFCYVWLV